MWNNLSPVKVSVDFQSLENEFAAKEVPKVLLGFTLFTPLDLPPVQLCYKGLLTAVVEG